MDSITLAAEGSGATAITEELATSLYAVLATVTDPRLTHGGGEDGAMIWPWC